MLCTCARRAKGARHGRAHARQHDRGQKGGQRHDAEKGEPRGCTWLEHGLAAYETRLLGARTAIMSAGQGSKDAAACSSSLLLPIENIWLHNTGAKLRVRQTPWEGFQRADLIKADDMPMLRDAERAGQQGDVSNVVARGSDYARLYIQMLTKLSRADTIQSVVLLIDDLLQAAPEHVMWFLDAEPYPALVKVLEVDDIFLSLKAAQFLTLCLCTQADRVSSYGAPPADVVDKLLQHIKHKLAEAASEAQDGAEGNVAPVLLCIVDELLRSAYFRRLIWTRDTAAQNEHALLPKVIDVLRMSMTSNTPSSKATGNTGVPQLHYLALFGLWELTFYPTAAKELDLRFAVAPVLVHVARKALKHKVVRLTVSIWRNMLAAAEDANATRLLGAQVLPLCETLEERRYPDAELQDDLAYVKSILSMRLEQMSSYEQYKSELYSGQLSFDNPAHMLEDFWKENAEKLTEHNNADLVQLVSLLQRKDADASTLAVACSDMGKFVHHMEGGRRRADALGAKTAIMQLVEHADDNVKYYALQALAVLVSTSWR